MIQYNKAKFFDLCTVYFSKFKAGQSAGLTFLLSKFQTSMRINSPAKQAYVLSTIKWETAQTYLPITEYGSEKYLKSKTYYPFIGRGYVQLTWKENYIKFGDELKIDLLNKPELANDPETAWKILEMGMTDDRFGIQDPDFTKYTLEDFINKDKTDFYNARKIVNPHDSKSFQPIADVAETFLKILRESIILPDPETEIKLDIPT